MVGMVLVMVVLLRSSRGRGLGCGLVGPGGRLVRGWRGRPPGAWLQLTDDELVELRLCVGRVDRVDRLQARDDLAGVAAGAVLAGDHCDQGLGQLLAAV